MGMLKKVLVWGSLALLAFIILFKPQEALGVAKILGPQAAEILGGLGDFFNALAS